MQVSDYIVKKYGRTTFPKQELLENGSSDELSTQDLVAVLIGTGSRYESVFSMSERLIRDYGSKQLAEIRDPVQLNDIIRIGLNNACKLVAAFELGRRFYVPSVKRRTLIRGLEDTYEYCKDMASLVKENLRGLFMNSKNIIIHDEIVSIGTSTGTMVHPREIFKIAIDCSANSIIIVHNHPSGEYEPSEHDNIITRMIKESGEILQIPLVDHIIIAENGYYSYNKERRI